MHGSVVRRLPRRMATASRSHEGKRGGTTKEFRDKVAVITGAASGIGRGLAERCLREGMKVLLADVDEAALAQTEREMKDEGADVIAMRTDVSKFADVDALAQRTLDAFGA